MAVSVVISDLVSAFSSNLFKCCFSCYLSFVFSAVFVNKAPFSIFLLVGLLQPCTPQDDLSNNTFFKISLDERRLCFLMISRFKNGDIFEKLLLNSIIVKRRFHRKPDLTSSTWSSSTMEDFPLC
ncbi:hypothetical protein AVEN_181839-1 [Araneus ventricosus]|uniref:Uncharacterized protein n=1 Tax=Araneus ventricosus TaxID=182803 RepID=A0A4Y2F0F1_ARAVE|nr:hypothetical protein AVEN_181839-1 [Araneus ventricosus]